MINVDKEVISKEMEWLLRSGLGERLANFEHFLIRLGSFKDLNNFRRYCENKLVMHITLTKRLVFLSSKITIVSKK